MKSILLATASILAFAGAAAAEVTFGGSASLGYNLDDEDENDNGVVDSADCDGADEDDGYDCEQGFFWEVDLGVTFSQELNNGLTAAATFGVNILDENGDDSGDLNVDDDFLLSLTAETGGLFLGDTEFAAEKHWNGITNADADRFSEQDDEVTLRGDFTYQGIDASVSYVLADEDGDQPENNGLDQLSIGAAATFGAFNMTVAYQEESEIAEDELDGGLDDSTPCVDGPDVDLVCEPLGAGDTPAFVDATVSDYNPTSNDDFSVSRVFGVSAGSTFSGADFNVAYANDMTLNDTSLGVEASYPFGPVTLGAYYVIENDDSSDFDPGNEDLENAFGLTADYESGPLTVEAFWEINDDDGNTTDDDGETDDDNDSDFGVEAVYAVDETLTIKAGYIDSTEGYIGAEYDLGGGANVVVSYAEQDEEGNPEYEEGITVALNLAF